MRAAEGLVIGKFMPPHLGHAYLIQQAQAQVDHLTVVIFIKSPDPIPGALREGWLSEMCPGVTIRHVTAEHPVDFDSDAIWQLWVNEIRVVTPPQIDVVFSSEDYGAELARRLGARHVAVDPARQRVPISATQVRASPLEQWDYLSPGVRAFYVRRVAILGAESTGKTTLAQNLARHFNTVWVPEFARDYLAARNVVVRLEDMPVIAQSQAESEDRLAREANRLLFCDTELITTSLWHERYWGWCPPDLAQLAYARAPRYCLFLLSDSTLPWIDDGLRDSPNHREWFDQRFLRILQERQLPYRVLSGTYVERTAQAIQAVEALLR